MFSFVVLDKTTRTKHFKKYIDKKINVGVLEPGAAETHSKAFEWNRKHGNPIWWRNHWFFYESWSCHATQV
ncbi:hypothetical protein [Mycoplasmopsis bovirhinis]|uniref:hypothetical protein n=1 Tax=Mycoplasmopsis bovirhinis TaxID=29553 RepID=UPI00101D42F7|nr:hypothetical protein [Mycoplasmopsis bovirhinis]